jgi:hypothetical protein
MKERKKLKLFISYSQKDKEAAAKIEQKLQENGFDVWRVEIPYL